MNDQEKQQFVSDYLDALNKGDVERIVTLYDENGSCEDPVGRPAVVGTEAIRTFYQKAIQQGVSAESTGAARCAGSAVAAPYLVMVGNMRIELITVFEFNDKEKITSMKAYWGPENISKI
jgi:steroid delta-isomerase